MLSSLSPKFAEFAFAHTLFENEQRVLLAVSGGLDSMVLLDLMLQWQQRWRLDLGVAHFNHRLRGADSAADAEFVREVAASAGLPFYADSANIAELTEKGESLEAVARQHREAFLIKCATGKGYDRIATAHHSDDQAETLLMRIIRGTGPVGLAGIRLKRASFVRPLLFATREEILSYAREKQIAFREDASNRDQKFLRNRIRSQLIPFLREQFDVKNSAPLFRLAMIMQDWERQLEAQLSEAQKALRHNTAENKIQLDISTFRQYFSAIQQGYLEAVLSTLLKQQCRIQYQQLQNFKRWLNKCRDGSVFLFFNRVAVHRKGNDLIFCLHAQLPETDVFIDLWPGDRIELSSLGLQLSLKEIPAGEVRYDKTPACQFVDADHLTYPLNLRRWQAGDRFRPLGLDGSKTVSDYLTDRKIPRLNRSIMCVLLCGRHILALPGEQIDDRFKLTASTRVALQVETKQV